MQARWWPAMLWTLPGGHLGILAEGEKPYPRQQELPGRMGHPNSEVYLANRL